MRWRSYEALAAEYRRDQVAEEIDACESALEHTQASFAEATKEVERAKEEAEHAAAALTTLLDEARARPELQEQKVASDAHGEAITQHKRRLTTTLQRVVDAFGRAGRLAPDARAWALLEKPWRELLDRVRATVADGSLDVDPEAHEARLGQTIAPAASLLADARREERDASDLQSRCKLEVGKLRDSLKRANEGRAQLSDSVGTVRRILEDAGISATPVCDLARITDAAWAPAIEGFLRGNVEALLVEPGREDEAIAVYESIPATANPFNVKIVKPRKRSIDLGALPEDALARLVTGNNEHAVAFLQARLGRLRRLEKASVHGPDGLTKTC
ncbi:MAG: hypothetical protein KC492_19090, partial [Myxococcales bacterium]|nr:hypothetical protein [Myxococcales bacterium]